MSPRRPPKQRTSALTRDCHFYIFGPYDRFPLSAGRAYDSPPAQVPEYLAMVAAMRASVSGTDNAAKLYGF